jgi:hypothetical protein
MSGRHHRAEQHADTREAEDDAHVPRRGFAQIEEQQERDEAHDPPDEAHGRRGEHDADAPELGRLRRGGGCLGHLGGRHPERGEGGHEVGDHRDGQDRW